MPFLNKGAGGDAAKAEVAGAQLGIDEIRNQFGLTQQRFDETQQRFGRTEERFGRTEERFGETQAGISPFIQAGQQALGGVQASGTVQGIEATIAQILGGGAFQELVGERERAARGQLAAGGLTRSGTALEEISAIPTDLAFRIENLLAGRQANLAGQGQSAALGLGALSGELGSQSGQLGNQSAQLGSQSLQLGSLGGQAAAQAGGFLQQQGVSTGAGILTNAQEKKETIQQAITLASSMFFSDERLKENIEVVTSIGDLDVVQWDWKEFTKGTEIEKCGTIGFLAQDVREKYAHHVHEICGWLAIDYHGLLDELEMKYAGRVQSS